MSMKLRLSRFGLTILELIVAAAIMSLIGLAMVFLYSSSLSTYNHGAGRLALHHKARQATQRIAPIILAAFSDPSDSASEEIEFPAINTTGNELVVTTTEDWLNPNYPDINTSSRFWDSSSLSDATRYDHHYRVRLDAGTILLERGTWDDSTNTFTPTGEQRIFGRTDDAEAKDAVTITGLTFEKLAANAVRVRVDVQATIRNARNQERDLTYTSQSIVQIPNVSLRAPL